MTIRKIAAWACAAAMLAAFADAPSGAATPIPAGEKMAPDPAVRTGTLANGMRYSVMQNGSPAGAISVRLAMNFGSYVEEEKERGFAHFVEHMAFRATRRLPDGALDRRFARHGLTIGRDQNAFTTLTETVYRVDLPSNSHDGLAAVLEWMRDAADGIVFDKPGLDVERSVLFAEKEARRSAATDVQKEVAEFQAAGLRSTAREPIGTDETLRAATPAALQAFYDRWYRPENATLVIVGDLPAAELEKLARDHFSAWTARGAAGTRPTTGTVLAERGLDAFVRAHESIPPAVSMCRFAPPDPDRSGSLERMRREIFSNLWTAILNKRLARAAQATGAPLLGGNVFTNRGAPDFAGTCVIALPLNGRWKEALAAAQSEFRRFADQGPTETEVTQAVGDVEQQLAASSGAGVNRTTSAAADQIVDSALNGWAFPSYEEAARTLALVTAGVTPADLKAALAADWRGSGPLVAVVGREAPARDMLLAAWKETEEAKPLAAYADREQAEWLYTDFGKRGRVAKRQKIADPGFTRVTFRNGVVLNFRQTDFEPGGAEMRVRFGHGERALRKEERALAQLASGLFPAGALGRMSFEDIASVFDGYPAGLGFAVETDAFLLSSSTYAYALEDQAQLLAAFLTDPGFGALMDEKLPTAVDIVYRLQASDPNATALNAFEAALFPDQPSMPPPDVMAAVKAQDFERLLKPALTRAPLEITIVGDLKEKQAIRAVANTFGALPVRVPPPAPGGEGPFRRFPVEPPSGPIVSTHDGPPEKAAALLVWPLYVASPERRREEYAISLASSIFSTRVFERVRMKMGKVYSPEIGNPMPDHADQGYLSAAFETLPADLDAVVAAAREVAREMAGGAISQDELDAARTPAVAARNQLKTSNAAWAGVLSQSLRHPEALDELFRYDADLAALTLEEVRNAAATWLSRDPIVALSRPKTAVAAASGG